jgi:hypothetical protein
VYYLLNDVFSSVYMQDREIIRVIVDRCLHEKIFNKYYTILVPSYAAMRKITSSSYRYIVTINQVCYLYSSFSFIY